MGPGFRAHVGFTCFSLDEAFRGDEGVCGGVLGLLDVAGGGLACGYEFVDGSAGAVREW